MVAGHPPRRTAPHHPRSTQPPKGMQAKGTVLGPHTHTAAPTARGWRTPTARPVGGQSGEGQLLSSDAPHNGGRHPPPETPFRHPPGEQRRPARAHTVGPVLGPHACTDRTRDTLVAEPGLPAREHGRPGERQRLTPGAPHNGGRHPPPGTPFHHPHSEKRRPARAHAVGPVLGPNARTDRTRDTQVAEPWLPAPEDGRPGEGQRLTPDAPRNDGRHAPLGTPFRHPYNEQRTNAPTHQPQDIRTPPPALRHSDTTMAEPAAPRKTRPRSQTLDAAHEVIRALRLRDGEGDPPQGDAGTDSALEAVPEPSTGSAPAEPAPPAGSVPTLCPAWKRGHCTGEGWCPKQHPQLGPDDGALPEVGPAAACAALRYGVQQGLILDETARGRVNIQEAVGGVTHAGQAGVALHTRGRHGGPAEGIIVEPSGMVLVLAADMV